ncbi:unnamed protein product [Symbiodinium natans]|uniref:Coiled-coil domain-containing protein 104 n=1 Tax=Symbiodinium natans TaxID=878477 RepID=A0A812R443_9DINO|nr:unnamed protein product [Symbiodinium natans]
MSETLPNYFLQHLRQNPQILESIRDFQVKYRSCFVQPSCTADDYTQEQRAAYMEFANLIDLHMSQFFALYGGSEEDFVAGLEWMKATEDANWHAYQMCIKQIEFESFTQMLRADVCLCCGKPFASPGHPLPARSPYMPAGDEPPPAPPVSE